jgi:NAD(P)-dependent dehydrogenase (short-subunit alcohol dehydrogenase family)
MRYVAILGASGTTGSTLARRLTAAGDRLLLLGRHEEKLRPLAEELKQQWCLLDTRSSAPLEEVLREHTLADLPWTGLVNCIGSVLLKPAHTTTDDEFRATLETNLFTSFATIRAAAKVFSASGGAVVLFASAAAEIGIANHEAIAAAKGGVAALVRSAAATYASRNIRVNAISPGLVRTELTRSLWENPASAAASAAMHPLKRIGEPGQLASLADWLLATENDWLTGQVIGCDGGLARVMSRK